MSLGAISLARVQAREEVKRLNYIKGKCMLENTGIQSFIRNRSQGKAYGLEKTERVMEEELA